MSLPPHVHLTIHGLTKSSINPPLSPAHTTPLPPPSPPLIKDIVIIGGGLAGLSAAYQLRHQDLLVLERTDSLGGIVAPGETSTGIPYAKGSIYFTKPWGDILTLYNNLNLPSLDSVTIASPGEAILRDGKLELEPWTASPSQLPEFQRFSEFVTLLNTHGYIGSIPLEESGGKVLVFDTLSADNIGETFGNHVREWINLYCQSTLGAVSQQTSAMAFLNFFLGETLPRYSFPTGNGEFTLALTRGLDKQRILSGATVVGIRHLRHPSSIYHSSSSIHHPSSLTEITYTHNATTYTVLTRFALVCTSCHDAAAIIHDLPHQQRSAFEAIQYTDYLIHNIVTDTCIYRSAFDTWIPGACFSDVIVGRWMEAKIRQHSVEALGQGVLNVCQMVSGYDELNDKEVSIEATKVYNDLTHHLPQLSLQHSVTMSIHRWIRGMHRTPPGFFTNANQWWIRQPFGGIYFASSSQGVPCIDEALYRGLSMAKVINSQLMTIKVGTIERPIGSGGSSSGSGSSEMTFPATSTSIEGVYRLRSYAGTLAPPGSFKQCFTTPPSMLDAGSRPITEWCDTVLEYQLPYLSQNVSAGVWAATAHTCTLSPYPVTEVVMILEGDIHIRDRWGNVQMFQQNDVFVIIRGAMIQYHQPGYVKKYFFIIDDASGEGVRGKGGDGLSRL